MPPVGLPFTYPPVSAVIFALLATLPVRAGQVVWMVVSLVGLCVFVRMVLQRYATGVVATSTTALLVVVAVVSRSDPLRVNLLLGQINVLDRRAGRRRPRGRPARASHAA